MTEPSRITSDDRDERAALWCMRLAEARLDADGQAEFDRWIAADARNIRAFEEAVAIWQGMDAIADTPEIIRHRAEAVESLRQVNVRRWSRTAAACWRCPPALAACIAIALIALIALLADGKTHYKTGIGERRVVMLADGSRLTLDAASHVDVRLEDDRRTLELVAGRAKFDVAHDPLRPFSVRARDRVTVATGTSFSVELLPSQVRVVLYEGRVEVLDQQEEATQPASHASGTSQARPERGVALHPGNELIASKEGAEAMVISADLTRSLAWESGLLSFDGEPLALATARMNRYAKTPIVVRGPDVGAYEISGVFAAGDVEAFVEGVTALYPIRVTRERGELVLASAR